MNDDLKERVRNYLTDTGVAKTVFCDKVDISRTYLYMWLDCDYHMRESTQERISNYLKHFNY